MAALNSEFNLKIIDSFTIIKTSTHVLEYHGISLKSSDLLLCPLIEF